MTTDKANRKQGVHSRKTREKIFRVFLVQAVLCVILSAILLLDSLVSAWSALLGGGLYLIPNIYFAHRALRFRDKQSAGRALAEMYVSQIWKMGISILGFSAVFIFDSTFESIFPIWHIHPDADISMVCTDEIK